MSEQSGPITREQVERAIELSERGSGISEAFGGCGWARVHGVPRQVVEAWSAIPFNDDRMTAALTRWRDELAAAEPVRRVARWDADLEAYTLTPTHDDGALMTHAVEDAAKARAWGYEIEGGPEPIQTLSRCPDCGGPRTDMDEHDAWCDGCWEKRCKAQPAEDSPERLRERREALGWTTAYAGHWVPWFDHTDVERAESGKGIPAFVARYAAALSAEEARLAAEGADRVIAAIGRPAPRFKVGDWVVDYRGTRGQIERAAWSETQRQWRYVAGPIDYPEAHLEPASPPAPEVVDVPQPIVKRCGGVEAQWDLGEDHVTLVEPARGVGLPAPLALLRAMLADIDAQQGGAS